jgi:hypothetical protein
VYVTAALPGPPLFCFEEDWPAGTRSPPPLDFRQAKDAMERVSLERRFFYTHDGAGHPTPGRARPFPTRASCVM